VTATCPLRRELLRLLDGEATENRAVELRAHAAGCATCAAELRAHEALLARVAAPVAGLPSPGAVEAVMARIRAAPSERIRAPLRRTRLLAGLAAAAAVVVAVLVLAPRGRDAGDFRARGASVEWTRKVGVELWAL
jgi:anti-sigma factor RsiW